jgi:hypothetical protein
MAKRTKPRLRIAVFRMYLETPGDLPRGPLVAHLGVLSGEEYAEYRDIGGSARAAVRHLRDWLMAAGAEAPGLARKQGKVAKGKQSPDPKVSSRKDTTDAQ